MNTAARTTGHSDAGETAWREFRRSREAELAAEHGVLSQVGLHWLDPGAGEQTIDEIPGRWEVTQNGVAVTWEGDELSLLAGAPVVERDDRGGQSRAHASVEDSVRLARTPEGVVLDVIRRGGRLGVRPLDPATPRRAEFTSVPTYPYDPSWVIEGTWSPQPATVTVGSALDWLEHTLPSPGLATLELGGATVQLRLTGQSSLFFTDGTSGIDSSEWRMVVGEIDGSRIRVDLNRALNLPSAFTLFGTCPRPPAGNHLPVAVTAGERRVEPTAR